MTVGEKISEERKWAGMTQKELGEKTGIDGATIGKYERGVLNPKIETLRKIADALSCSVTDLDESIPLHKKMKSLKVLRENRKLSQKELAKEIGESPSEIEKIENGTIIPPVDTMRKIANVLHCSLAEIFLSVYDEPVALEVLRAMQEADRVMNPWNTIDGSMFLVGMDEQKIRLLEAYDSMNAEGQQTAVERVEELAQLPKYQKKHPAGDNPQSAGTGDEKAPK